MRRVGHLDRQLDVPRSSDNRLAFLDSPHGFADVRLRWVQDQSACLHFGQHEHVVGERPQPPGLGQNDLQVVPQGFVLDVPQDHFAVTNDGRQRAAHVVDDHVCHIFPEAKGGLKLVILLLDAEHAANARAQLDPADRLGKELVGAGLQPSHQVLLGVERGHENDRNGAEALVGLQPLADLEPVHARHHDVLQDQIRCEIGHLAQCLLAVFGKRQLVSLAGQKHLERLTTVALIIYDED